MKDWIKFNKDAGSEVMAKIGRWNLAVAARAISETMEQHLQEQKIKELPPIHAGETYEVVLCNGTKFVGLVDERRLTWIKMRDKNENSIIVRVSEIAYFVEQYSKYLTSQITGGKKRGEYIDESRKNHIREWKDNN